MMKYFAYLLIILLVWLPLPARAGISIADLQLTLAVTKLLDDQYSFVITAHNAGPDFAEGVNVHFETAPGSIPFDASIPGLASGETWEYDLTVTADSPFSAHALVDGWFTDPAPNNNSATLYFPYPRQLLPLIFNQY